MVSGHIHWENWDLINGHKEKQEMEMTGNGNWKLETELETEMEMQCFSCCSPRKVAMCGAGFCSWQPRALLASSF